MYQPKTIKENYMTSPLTLISHCNIDQLHSTKQANYSRVKCTNGPELVKGSHLGPRTLKTYFQVPKLVKWCTMVVVMVQKWDLRVQGCAVHHLMSSLGTHKYIFKVHGPKWYPLTSIRATDAFNSLFNQVSSEHHGRSFQNTILETS